MLVNMHDAKSQLSRLVERASAGEESIIGRAGRPVARLAPYDVAATEPRRPGRLRGKIHLAEDFDETPPEVLAGFEGP